MLLGIGAAAWAQEGHFNLLDEKAAPEAFSLPDEQQEEKKKGQEDIPTVIIPAGALKDELPVGPYRRPMWTLHRMSPTTRIYLQVDPGEVEFEQWLDCRFSKDRRNPDDHIRMAQELEFGLGGRFQLDLYMNTIFNRSGENSTLTERSWAAEIRYALADWGVIPGNPTLYLEYILWNNQPDAHGDAAASSIEPKLLLGGEIATGWRWGMNFFYERTLNNSVREHGATGTVARTVVDGVFSAGATIRFVYESDFPGEPFHPGYQRTHELYLGPSLQFRMAFVEIETEVNGVKTRLTKARAHLDIEPIWGLTGESDRVQFLLVFGWDF
jgi:hypothetical protein